MDRAFGLGLGLEPAARAYDERLTGYKTSFSPVFSTSKLIGDMTALQHLGGNGFGAKELLAASTSLPFTMETPSGYLSVNGSGSIGLPTATATAQRDSDRVDMWGDGAFVPFDLHLSPAQQQQRSQFQSLYSPLTRPQAVSHQAVNHQAMAGCVEPLGAADFNPIEDSAGDEAYQSDVASALSSLLEDDDKFCRQSNGPSPAPRADALPDRINMAVKPPPQQPRVWEQYSPSVAIRRPECSQQFLSFQSARQQQQHTRGGLSSPGCHYGVRQPVAPSSTAQAEQWRRQLMLKRSSAAMYSSASSPFATAMSTPPSVSNTSGSPHPASLGVSYQSPAHKRARMTPSACQFLGHSSQPGRLVPPAPIPLQNGVDGGRASPFAMLSTSRAGLWQGVARPAFAPMGFPSGLHRPQPPPPPPPSRQIGIYSPVERRARIQRFLEKRKHRVFHKRIKYDCRKRLASACPRIKGRFVRRDEYLAAVERGQRVTHPHADADADADSRSPVVDGELPVENELESE